MKKVVITFNCSNNLTRDLLNVQNDNPLNLLSDETEKSFKTTKKCVLQLIQDMITRSFYFTVKTFWIKNRLLPVNFYFF